MRAPFGSSTEASLAMKVKVSPRRGRATGSTSTPASPTTTGCSARTSPTRTQAKWSSSQTRPQSISMGATSPTRTQAKWSSSQTRPQSISMGATSHQRPAWCTRVGRLVVA